MGGVKGLEALVDALRSVGGRRDVCAALHGVLFPIEAYDERTHSGLVPTLRTFVALGGNVHATAEALFLHRNSVGFRLHRIEALTGIDPRDQHARLALTAAFAIADPRILQSLDDERIDDEE